MKNPIKILFLINFNLLFSYSILENDLQNFESNPPSLINNIDMTHGFSMASFSSNGFSSSYGIYKNSTLFSINEKTELYSNLNLMYSLENMNYSDRTSYSVDVGLKYRLNENTEFIFQISTVKYPAFFNNNLGNF